MNDSILPPPPLDTPEQPAPAPAPERCCGNCSGWTQSTMDPRQGLCMAAPPSAVVAMWQLRPNALTGVTVMEPVREAALFPPMPATGRCRDGWKPLERPTGETEH